MEHDKSFDKRSVTDSGFNGSPLRPRFTSTPKSQRSVTARTLLNRSRPDDGLSDAHMFARDNSTRGSCLMLMCVSSLIVLTLGQAVLLVYWSYDHVRNFIDINAGILQRHVKLGGQIGILCTVLCAIALLIVKIRKMSKTVVTFNNSQRSDVEKWLDNVPYADESDRESIRESIDFPSRNQKWRRTDIQVNRMFSGENQETWSEFLEYFENLAELNRWTDERRRRLLLSTLRGLAESYAYGLPLVYKRNYSRLVEKMEERFGHASMKEKYMAEAKLRRRNKGESLRDFGQALENLYRRAYKDKPYLVEEHTLQAFLDKCGDSEEFRLAVKRTRPKNIFEAVSNAMQEECLRVGERELRRDIKPPGRPVMSVDSNAQRNQDYENTVHRGTVPGRYQRRFERTNKTFGRGNLNDTRSGMRV